MKVSTLGRRRSTGPTLSPPPLRKLPTSNRATKKKSTKRTYKKYTPVVATKEPPETIEEIWKLTKEDVDSLSEEGKWFVLEEMLKHHNWAYKFSSKRAFEKGEKENGQICKLYGRLVELDKERLQKLYYSYSIFFEENGDISKHI